MRTVILRFLGNTKHHAFNLVQRIGNYPLKVGDIITLPGYITPAEIVQIAPGEFYYVDTRDMHLYYENACESKDRIAIRSTEYSLTKSIPVEECPITLQEAKKLYEQGEEFRDIALRFYSQKQLTAISSPLTPWQKRNREVMEKLQGIANYYNNGWKREQGSNGYFCNYNSEYNKWEVRCHCKVTYPGIIYFKTKEDAWNALRSLTCSERDALIL